MPQNIVPFESKSSQFQSLQLRDVFLKGVSKLGTGYNYLKRIAVQAQKKRALLQRKGATADDEAKFRAKNYGIQAANLPLKDFLYQVGKASASRVHAVDALPCRNYR